MSFFKGLPKGAGAKDIFGLNPEAGRALIDVHTATLRQPSALSEGERELIAAYVSALNGCRYCTGIHGEVAAAFGIDADLLSRLMNNLDSSGVDPKLLPILRYAKVLTETPTRITETHKQAVHDAGWDERALHDAINVICLYNFMNRLVEGHGVQPGDQAFYRERAALLRANGYDPLKKVLDPA